MIKKVMIIALSIISAFALVSGGYGYWQKPLTITGSITVLVPPKPNNPKLLLAVPVEKGEGTAAGNAEQLDSTKEALEKEVQDPKEVKEENKNNGEKDEKDKIDKVNEILLDEQKTKIDETIDDVESKESKDKEQAVKAGEGQEIDQIKEVKEEPQLEVNEETITESEKSEKGK